MGLGSGDACPTEGDGAEELAPLSVCSCTCGDEAASGVGVGDGKTVGPVEGVVKAIAKELRCLYVLLGKSSH